MLLDNSNTKKSACISQFCPLPHLILWKQTQLLCCLIVSQSYLDCQISLSWTVIIVLILQNIIAIRKTFLFQNFLNPQFKAHLSPAFIRWVKAQAKEHIRTALAFKWFLLQRYQFFGYDLLAFSRTASWGWVYMYREKDVEFVQYTVRPGDHKTIRSYDH